MVDSLSGFGDSLAVISYHQNGLYVCEASEARYAFYDSLIEPHAIFDGTDPVFVTSPPYAPIYEDHVRLAMGVTPLFNLTVLPSADSTTGTVYVRIVAADTLPEASFTAFLAITEDSLPSQVFPNGAFDRVLRYLYQMPVELAYPDSTDTTIVFSHAMPVAHMRAVLFVQDLNSRTVCQAATAHFEEEP